MGIPHFSASIISHGKDASVVLAAAYRHYVKINYEREACTIDYAREQGLLHEQFLLPADAPKWVRSLIPNRSVSVR